MDRIEFFKSVKYPDFPNDITSHFEESVALYNLLKDVDQDIDSIIADEINPDSINFKIKASKEARDMTEALADMISTARDYCRSFDIEVSGKTRSSISVLIKKASRV